MYELSVYLTLLAQV